MLGLWVNLKAGVSHGSVHSLLLFLIHYNDITDKLAGKTRIYAEDTSLSFSSSSLAEIDTISNNVLSNLKEWAIKWLISFKPTKTEVVLVSNIFMIMTYA